MTLYSSMYSLYFEGATPKEIWDKFFQNKIPDLPLFFKLVETDPTAGPVEDVGGFRQPKKKGLYLDWILRVLWKSGDLTLPDEDGYFKTPSIDTLLRIYYALEVWETIKNQVKRDGKNADINQFSSVNELLFFAQPYKHLVRPDTRNADVMEDETQLIKNKFFIKNKEVRVLLDTDKYLVVSPMTDAASRFYGQGTQWCTRFPREFESYNNDTPLYIIIFKELLNSGENLRRIQVHFESEQVKDARDMEVGFRDSFSARFRKGLPVEVQEAIKKEYVGRDKLLDPGMFEGQREYMVPFNDFSDLRDLLSLHGREEKFYTHLLLGDSWSIFPFGFDLTSGTAFTYLEPPVINFLVSWIEQRALTEELEVPELNSRNGDTLYYSLRAWEEDSNVPWLYDLMEAVAEVVSDEMASAAVGEAHNRLLDMIKSFFEWKELEYDHAVGTLDSGVWIRFVFGQDPRKSDVWTFDVDRKTGRFVIPLIYFTSDGAELLDPDDDRGWKNFLENMGSYVGDLDNDYIIERLKERFYGLT